MNRDVHLCFIDFSKAFDNVKHEKLIEVALTEKIFVLSLICIGVKQRGSATKEHSVTSLIQPII